MCRPIYISVCERVASILPHHHSVRRRHTGNKKNCTQWMPKHERRKHRATILLTGATTRHANTGPGIDVAKYYAPSAYREAFLSVFMERGVCVCVLDYMYVHVVKVTWRAHISPVQCTSDRSNLICCEYFLNNVPFIPLSKKERFFSLVCLYNVYLKTSTPKTNLTKSSAHPMLSTRAAALHNAASE